MGPLEPHFTKPQQREREREYGASSRTELLRNENLPMWFGVWRFIPKCFPESTLHDTSTHMSLANGLASFQPFLIGKRTRWLLTSIDYMTKCLLKGGLTHRSVPAGPLSECHCGLFVGSGEIRSGGCTGRKFPDFYGPRSANDFPGICSCNSLLRVVFLRRFMSLELVLPQISPFVGHNIPRFFRCMAMN